MEWVTCPGCGLKHSRRPDGLCPRCRRGAGEGAASSGPGAGAPPLAGAPGPGPRPPPPYLTDGGAAVAVQPPPEAWRDPRGLDAPRRRAPVDVTVGTIVSRTVSVWWADLWRFAVLGAIAYVPIFLLAGAAGVYVALNTRRVGAPDASRGLGPFLVAGGLAAFALFCVQMGGVTHGTLQRLAGRRAGLGAMMGVGFRRAWPLLASTVLGLLLVCAGLVALVVPGLVLAFGLCLVDGAIVAEGAGPVRALRRSLALSKGHRLTIFGGLFVAGLFGGSLNMLVGVASIPLNLLGPRAMILTVPLTLLVQAATGSVGAVAAAVAYHDLRLAKEGADTSDLERVFE